MLKKLSFWALRSHFFGHYLFLLKIRTKLIKFYSKFQIQQAKSFPSEYNII